MEYIKKLIDIKNAKYLVGVLIIYAIYVEALTVYTILGFLNYQRALNPISGGLFFAISMSILWTPILYLISYVSSIILIIKNKSVGYLISGIVSFLILINSVNQIAKNHIPYTLSMVPNTIFWVVLIIIAFWVRIKLTKNKEVIVENKEIL